MPCCPRSFEVLCKDSDVDIISLPSGKRLPFNISKKNVGGAIVDVDGGDCYIESGEDEVRVPFNILPGRMWVVKGGGVTGRDGDCYRGAFLHHHQEAKWVVGGGGVNGRDGDLL